MEKEKGICFVIMPFGGYFDKYYENIYKPGIEDSGLDAFRADDIYKPTTIIKDIWNLIQSADIILADLTDQNANVFYELGLAHASKKPVIFIAESLDDIPFDLRGQRIITYNKDEYNWGDKLREEVVKYIKETKKSPLKSVVPVFLEVEESDLVSNKTKEYLELHNKLDLLTTRVNSLDVTNNKPKTNIVIPEISEYDRELLQLLSESFSQAQISKYFKVKNIYPNSISSIEKRINILKDLYHANNSVHLISLAKDSGII